MNPLLATSEIQTFLDSFSSKTRRRGTHCYEDRAVKTLLCLDPERRFQATVIGSEKYTVTFDYDPPTKTWAARCTCPVGVYCKHAYAGMLALRTHGAALVQPTSTQSKKQKLRAKRAMALAPAAPEPRQPVSTALYQAVIQALGRKLAANETRYVEHIQRLYSRVCTGTSVSPQMLTEMSPEVHDYNWSPLDLWPEFPRNDLEFWLYCAWEIRRREASLPNFMEGATDFSSIEAQMQAFEREKQIAAWREQLRSNRIPVSPREEPVDFRLMILPLQARVQWKSQSQEEFRDLKATHLRNFNDLHEAARLAVVPEAVGLWLALYVRYDTYTALNLDYDNKDVVKILNNIVRQPALAARVVSSDGEALARPTEPLQYRLRPGQAGDHYHLELVLPDGSSAPPVLLSLPGKPHLYLTERALFQGPVPHGFGTEGPLRIPAPALESADGVQFLDRLQVDLPPSLAKRTRKITVAVKLSCEIQPTYPRSETEAVFIKATARPERGEIEYCGPSEWFVQNMGGRPNSTKQTDKEPDGIISIQDYSVQRQFPALLEQLGAKWDDYHACWRVRLTKNFPETFVPWLESLPPGVEVKLDSELATLRDQPISGSVRLDVQEAGVDWFDLKVALNVSDLELTADELKLLLNARGRFVRLGNKGWRRLKFEFTPEDDESLARLGLHAGDFTAEPQRLHALQLADAAAKKFLPEEQVTRIQRRADELKTRVTPPVPEGIRAELRPYQVEGFHFLSYLTANRFGGVLADDMGLGKTLQTLTWLCWLRREAAASSRNGEAGAGAHPSQNGETASQPATLPSLVVCPKSVMDNWASEANRFFTGLRVRLWRGEEASALSPAREESDLIVVNYAQLRALSPDISGYRWHAVVLDEAQYIKNPDSQTAQVARSLLADHRLALTGTPIENRLLDLWSILAFAMPGVLGNRATFGRTYNQQDDPLARRRLAARVRPFLLRRTKEQVAKELPDRIEEDLACEMEGEQKTLYHAELKRAQQLLLRVQTQQQLNDERFNVLTSLLRLRQICCHPALVSDELKNAESAKVAALIDLLEPLMEEGHKVLVFSQFVSMLEILQRTVTDRGWRHFYLAGDTEKRGELVESFQNADGAAVFLISLKAGGFGLNLTAASYVVLFDPWWNPAVERQAIDRTHRIGQTSKVIAYRLLIKQSIEQKIRQLQRSKAALADDVLGEERFSQSLTLDDLRFLFGAD